MTVRTFNREFLNHPFLLDVSSAAPGKLRANDAQSPLQAGPKCSLNVYILASTLNPVKKDFL